MKNRLFLIFAIILVIALSVSVVMAGCKTTTPSTTETTAAETTAAETTAAETTAAATTAVETTAAGNVEITLIATSHFVPDSDKYLDKLVADWAASKGVKARVDHVIGTDLSTKIAAELNAGQGHDIVQINSSDTYLVSDSLSDVGTLMNDIQNLNGKVLKLGENISSINGIWKSIPFYHQSFPILYREDYCNEVGFTAEKMNNLTMDSFMELAEKLNATKHKVGFAIGNNDDSKLVIASILWGFGGALYGKDNAITVNSPETKKALEYVLKMYQFMPKEVLGWDASGNNLFMLSGDGAVTSNAPSIYAAAVANKLDFADKIFMGPFPKGPNGSFRSTVALSLAIPEYSPNKELAADLIKYLLNKENFVNLVNASQGYNQPLFEGLQDIPIWSENPSLSGYEPVKEDYLFVLGWPGPEAVPTPVTAQASTQGIMPNMFAKVAAGLLTPDKAMEWAQGELEKLEKAASK